MPARHGTTKLIGMSWQNWNLLAAGQVLPMHVPGLVLLLSGTAPRHAYDPQRNHRQMNDSRFDEVRLLVPVWGERYVAQFVDFCLASLLAEGNLPAAARRPCCLHLLTTRADADVIVGDRRWRQVQKICRTKISFIDDLVSKASAASLTLAYVRGLRDVGDRLTRTAFIFLVGDYLLARGALEAAISEIEAGASGVLTGNLQVEQKGMEAALKKFHSKSGRLSLDAGELMHLAFANLHGTTKAATVAGTDRTALPLHLPDANRLFWTMGENSLLGRFYLMHMMAILPEVDDFSIGGPSDYCLIPSLCPSGKVVSLNDSDRFCLVEMMLGDRPVDIRLGPQNPARLAHAIGVWATERHRLNAENALLFHAGPVDKGSLAVARSMSDAFVASVAEALPALPQTTDQHPYWPRMLEHFFVSAPAPASRQAIADLVGDPSLATARLQPMERFRRAFLGRLPGYRAWHPRWADWQSLRKTLAKLGKGKRVRVSQMSSQVLRDALVDAVNVSGAKETHFSDVEPAGYDICIAEYPQLAEGRLAEWFSRYVANLSAGGTIVLFRCDFTDETDRVYVPDFLTDAQARFDCVPGHPRLHLTNVSGVHASRWRRAIQNALMSNARSVATGGAVNALARTPILCVLVVASAIQNLLALATPAADVREYSSMIVFLTRKDILSSETAPTRALRKAESLRRARTSKRSFASNTIELAHIAGTGHAV